MATPRTAHKTLDEIVVEFLLKRQKTMHSYWKILPIACEAVRELQLTSLPMLNHTELTKTDDESWFILPKGYTEWVNVGIRFKERWIPIGVSERLMPVPMTVGVKGFNDQLNDQFQHSGDWTKWDSSGGIPYSYTGFMNFKPVNTDTNGNVTNGRFTNVPRVDEVYINSEKGLIMCPNDFPSNTMYLTYLAVGQVDTMTNIPLNAQAAIEAYIAWKYAQNRRGGLSEASVLKKEFNEQHRILRARENDLTATVVRRIVDRGYMIGALGYGDYGYGYAYPFPKDAPKLVKTSLIGVAGTTITSSVISGMGVDFIIINSVLKNTGYTVAGDTITFTDGTVLAGGESIFIYFN